MEHQWAVGTPVPAQSHSHPHPSSWAVPIDASPPSHLPIRPFPSRTFAGGGAALYPSPSHSNSYVQISPTPASYGNDSVDTIFKALGRYGKRLEVTTRRAADVAGGVWNHLKKSPNLTDAAISRLYQETKAYAEGGYDRIFGQTFDVLPGEQLLKSYACYLSTSAGPLVGTLYLSTKRLAFCSDKPIYDNYFQGPHENKYYKVVVHLHQLRSINSSSSMSNPPEKYIQIVTLDGRDFWFMGFISFDKALKHVKEAFHQRASYNKEIY